MKFEGDLISLFNKKSVFEGRFEIYASMVEKVKRSRFLLCEKFILV